MSNVSRENPPEFFFEKKKTKCRKKGFLDKRLKMEDGRWKEEERREKEEEEEKKEENR